MSTRDPRYDVLFEPVRIGPVTAKNRFYQVPHCTGLGWLRPRTLAAMRGVKAEGGWGVVCTEYCSIHPASDDLPYPYAALWNDADVRAHALMTERVHEHGALAAVELWFGGARTANLFTNRTAMDTDSRPVATGAPFQSRAMDRADIRALRRWHRDAALRARRAGFDVVYVYATHGYLVSNFLSAETNRRTDEYGGSLENRVRLVRELIEETREAVGDTCAVAVRFAADQGGGRPGEPVIGEHREMLEMLADLPDLWDINVSDYGLEMGVSRFVKEGALEAYVSYVKSVTTRPVVSVGRFTSPDAMVAQIRRGVMDFIGAARPSIADPFLPRKIEEGRIDDIRECIGCNVCYSGDGMGVPIRCTQNPTINEEWRSGWHPESIPGKASDARVLVVGAGPAGLEATRALGQRGYRVLLAEAQEALGGRARLESTLPGLSEWSRVSEYRVRQIQTLPNVEIYRASEMTPEDVLAVGADHVVIATGARWRADGAGLSQAPAPGRLGPDGRVYTPDDVMAGRLPAGPCIVYDDDHYYMGGVLAERVRNLGVPVTLVTPGDKVSGWGELTTEQADAQRRLLELGVDIVTAHTLSAFDGERAELECKYTGRGRTVAAEHLVTVTGRTPNDALYLALRDRQEDGGASSVATVSRIGDCEAPSIIARAVFAGHRYARELDRPVRAAGNPRRYERPFEDDP